MFQEEILVSWKIHLFNLSLSLFHHLFERPPICPSVHPSLHPSVYLPYIENGQKSMFCSTNRSVECLRVSLRIFACLSVRPFIYPSIAPSIAPSWKKGWKVASDSCPDCFFRLLRIDKSTASQRQQLVECVILISSSFFHHLILLNLLLLLLLLHLLNIFFFHLLCFSAEITNHHILFSFPLTTTKTVRAIAKTTILTTITRKLTTVEKAAICWFMTRSAPWLKLDLTESSYSARQS